MGIDGISPEQAKRILQAHTVNLAKKVADSKTLTAQELELVQSIINNADSSKGWAKNQVQLADILGVTRKTIQRWLKIDGNPGSKSNGNFNVAEWRRWAESRGSDVEGDDGTVAELKAKNIVLQNEKLEYQLSILKKQYVETEKVNLWGGELGAEIRKIVTQLHRLTPSIVGKSLQDVEKILKDKEDDILSQLHLISDRIEDFRNEPVA